MLAHRLWVGLFWLVVTAAGILTVGTTTNRLSTQFSVPGREGFETSQKISDLYGLSMQTDVLVPVVQLPQGTTVDSPGVLDQLRAFDQQIVTTGGTQPDGRAAVMLTSYASSGDRHFVSSDGRTTYSVVGVPNPPPGTAFDVPPQETALRALVNNAAVAGGTARLTGVDELVSNTSGSEGPSLLVETLLAGVGALAILAFVFASFVAFVPIIIAIASIMTTFLLILGLTTFTDISFIVQFLVGLIGLGVAIDYSLLIVTRWREERAHGLANDEAIHKAMETAGSAVVFSGTTVGIGLLALIVLPVPFLRSVGYGGMLIPIVSVAVAVTLLPVILHSIGSPEVRWPWRYRYTPGFVPLFVPRLLRRLATYPNVRKEAHASRGWVAWARGVVRWRWMAALVATVILAALVIPATHITVGLPVPTSLAQSGPARQGLDMLDTSGLGTAGFEPDMVLVSGGKDASAVATAAAGVPGMSTALVAGGTGWSPPPAPGTSVVLAFSTLPPDSTEGRNQIDTLRTAVRAAGGAGSALVGGSRAGSADFVSAVYGSFPLMLALVVVITFILLARAFRSLLLPLKAVLLNVISVAAAYGILVLVWQDGHGSKQIFGVDATGAISEWIPLMVFAFLFGLSMDYEVFILARIREEYDRTGNTDLAVVRAMGRTGRLVTSAALILFLAFVALGSTPQTIIRTFATALAAGILLDATVVRMLLVPALVSLFGRWNWWLPRSLAGVLRVRPSVPRQERRQPVLPQEA
ncbi:MAG TPA: MMPL family transporter [Candidatus Dormibacteraeota bacterium]|nr:MMPL family transporter [Candidatus Dormibacteraeota bacterium]